MADKDGDEDDGFDEAICCVDKLTIIDDVLHERMVKPLNPKAQLVAIMDCCHSGTGLDLPYRYTTTSSDKKTKKEEKKKKKKKGKAKEEAGDLERVSSKGDKEGRVMMISGCKDEQCSADTHLGGGYSGAMTFALIHSLNQFAYRPTLKQLISSMHVFMQANRQAQIPQLTTNVDDLNLVEEFWLAKAAH